MSILDGKQLQQAREPTDAEMLEEARAWGFDTAKAWLEAMDAAHEENYQ